MKEKFRLTQLFRHMLLLPTLSCFCLNALGGESTALTNDTQHLRAFSAKVKLNPKDLSLGIKSAKERQQLLLQLLRKNPHEAAKYLLPKKVVSALPRPLQVLMEDEVTNVVGTLEIRAAVSQHHPEVFQYLVQGDDGKIYYLNFADAIPDNLHTGDKVMINHAYLLVADDGYPQLILNGSDVDILAAGKWSHLAKAVDSPPKAFKQKQESVGKSSMCRNN